MVEDIRDFLKRQERLGGIELLSLSSVSDWARQSDWSIDTGGERDARGAPVRATGGVWRNRKLYTLVLFQLSHLSTPSSLLLVGFVLEYCYY